jgi:hypothetical protein
MTFSSEGRLMRKRQNDEPPFVVSRRGWRYHHLGIPVADPHPGERHLEHLKVHVTGFETSPYGIEWMRFEPGCQVHDLIRRVPHLAFQVDNLERALRGCTILTPVNSPSPGVRVAMIIDDGAPIELIEFRAKKGEGRKGRVRAARKG